MMLIGTKFLLQAEFQHVFISTQNDPINHTKLIYRRNFFFFFDKQFIGGLAYLVHVPFNHRR